jgi:hypothetical protein
MALGRPVIATAYSGNLDFMTAENAFLVDWRYGSVPTGCAPYDAGERWAEPDLDSAAGQMRLVASSAEERARRAALGRAEILAGHGIEARTRFVASRLRAIENGRRSASVAGMTPDPERKVLDVDLASR